MGKSKSLDEIKAGWDEFDRPKDGQIFQHYKGGEYEIVATGFLEDSEVPCVIYKSLLKDIVWVRTAQNFLEEAENNGQKLPRFKPVSKSQ